ncbi:hypothetical protein [Pseudanabaena sp. PCC 6802]|uniref:hypothetical protein n=1 Tax=Pseudanabaena sp. PCC 6802 TaxID=118173 RepID=UPI0003453C9B|nr:hypothetical protein [Pseudanabaena sp. PCC 6802]
MNEDRLLTQVPNLDRVRAIIAFTLTTSRSAKFDVDTNLQLLDYAWEAQKQLWASQELLAS